MADVSLAPIVDALTPIVLQVAALVIAGGISWAATKFAQATHINLQQAALDKLTKAAQAEAGALVAAAHDNLAGVSITVAGPLVASAAARIVGAIPDTLTAAGVTPSSVATMIAGEIGRLQAQMTVAPPVAQKPDLVGRALT